MHTFNFKMDQRASLQHEDMIEKEAAAEGEERSCSRALEHLQFVESLEAAGQYWPRSLIHRDTGTVHSETSS